MESQNEIQTEELMAILPPMAPGTEGGMVEQMGRLTDELTLAETVGQKEPQMATWMAIWMG